MTKYKYSLITIKFPKTEYHFGFDNFLVAVINHLNKLGDDGYEVINMPSEEKLYDLYDYFNRCSVESLEKSAKNQITLICKTSNI